MIQSLLIANRGEIACRIIRTARKMGIRTIAVYSDADSKALHVRSADEAIHIGPSPAAESYLVGEKIIAAAKQSGAEAIHPGYGFLSENAAFAQAVIDAGIIWVGPKPHAIDAMGLKDAAKILMSEAGVPVTPGYIGDNQDPDHLAAQADTIGYPVLIKAIAGGGGKGMRKVDHPADFADSLTSCQREASASFGNAIVLLEKWIESPRHIEVQIFGDSHGNVVHLFERDCSLQRRHQKVIEEAPAPGMDEATREAVCGAAVRAAKAVDYESAGTIEFIADGSDGLKADKIWFMEMNTRLQVEHPVTEEITGVDLVEWQLRVASGEAIPLKQEELSINGHAIEARLYAEDPSSGFLPSTGPLEDFEIDTDTQSINFNDNQRVETGVQQGDEVSPFYDPMIAKLVVKADNRDQAIQNLTDICNGVRIYPVKTNASFLAKLLQNEVFQSATMTTALISNLDESIYSKPALSGDAWDEVSNLFAFKSITDSNEYSSFSGGMAGFRLNNDRNRKFQLEVDGEIIDATFSDDLDANDVIFLNHCANDDGNIVFDNGCAYRVNLPRFGGNAGGAASDGAILSPMPGKIIAVEVREGDSVTKGQKLLTLEAMKMEHSLTAPFDGLVSSLPAKVGGQVQVDALLAQIDATEE